MKFHRVIFLSLLLTVVCFSATEAQWTGFHRVIDKEQRFSKNFEVVIGAMAEDSLGNIWIASKNGLCKYNGSETRFFIHDPSDSTSISSNNIESMYLDKSGHIWLAAADFGIDVLDLQGHRINHFQHDPQDEQSLLSDRVWGMFQDEMEQVWISYYAGGISSYSLRDKTFQHFDFDAIVSDTITPIKTVTSIVPDDSEMHCYWLATKYGLVKWNTANATGKSFLFYSDFDTEKLVDEHNQEKLSSNHHRYMKKDSDGILWLGTYGGLVRFDPKTEDYQVFFQEEGSEYPLKNIVGIIDFSEEELLITLHTGLAFFNKKSYAIELAADRYPDSGENYLFGRTFESTNGCIYLASLGRKRGLYKMCEQHKLIPKTHIPRNTYQVIATEDYVHYYGGSKMGIVSSNLSDGKTISYPYKNIESQSIRAIQNLGGDSLLVANTLEAYYYHPDFGIKPIPEMTEVGLYRMESIFLDSDDLIWSGRQKEGIFRYDTEDGLGTQINQKNGELPDDNLVVDIFEDSENDIWISTERGWSLYNRKEDYYTTYVSKDLYRDYKVRFKGISAIRETPDGKIWIVGSTDGVIVWNKQQDSLEAFIKYGQDIELNGSWDAEIDKDGDIWIVNDHKELAVIDYRRQKTKLFSASYGINSLLYSINVSPSGKMYIGSSSGYYEFDPNELKNYQEERPKPIVSGLSIFNINKDSLIKGNKLHLEHDENFFTFRFTSQNYVSPELEKFEIRMSPVDKEWISMGEKREKGYTKIPAGKYTFQVRSKTNNIDWQYSPTIQLKIKQVWYKSWLFRLLLAFALLGGLGYYIYWRRQLIIKELETEKLLSDLNAKALRTQMNPHFLFNSLNSIRYQILSEDKQKAADYLTKFSRLVRIILQNSEKDFVTISSELNLMSLYIDMEQIRFVDAFEYEVSIDPKIEQDRLLIPPMIIQPFIENSIIHGINPLETKGLIKLSMCIKDELLHIQLEDNGIGRAASRKLKQARSTRKSMGMQITKSRIDLLMESSDINQRLIEDLVQDGEVKGTLVHFVLPLIYSDKR